MLIFFPYVKSSPNRNRRQNEEEQYMCFKGSEMCQASAVQAVKQPPRQPKTIDREGFDKIAARLRAGSVTPADILTGLDIIESSIMPTRLSLASFLEQCEDNGTAPIECFIAILETFMSNYGYLKEEKEIVIAARKEEARSLEARLEEARRRGNKDEIIEIALSLIQEQRETIKVLERKACLA